MVKKVLTDIHRYWFGDLKSPADVVAKEKADTWFRQSDATDAHIRDTFGKYLNAAAETEWDLSHLTRQEQVALVVLLDQFPRNMFRQTGDAFAHDAKARQVAMALIKGGAERYYLPERTFVFMPLMHSEAVADQDHCVMLFAAESMRAAEPAREGFRQALDFATKHRDIIRKFGRFPHRNLMLGRESTPEEVEFLRGGRGF
jgi:uncharacterized protein (DUF924 family)